MRGIIPPTWWWCVCADTSNRLLQSNEPFCALGVDCEVCRGGVVPRFVQLSRARVTFPTEIRQSVTLPTDGYRFPGTHPCVTPLPS